MPLLYARKKVVVTVIRRECVYKRTGLPNVAFYEKGGAVERETDFLQKNRNKRSLLRRGGEDGI